MTSSAFRDYQDYTLASLAGLSSVQIVRTLVLCCSCRARATQEHMAHNVPAIRKVQRLVGEFKDLIAVRVAFCVPKHVVLVLCV